MDNNEYRLKCKNFRDKARSSFKYLINEFDYELRYDNYTSQSGSIIINTLIYTNEKRNRIIKISNSFHPKDYGFEIKMVDISKKKNKNIVLEKLVFGYPLKNQDFEQNYLLKISERFKTEHYTAIVGKSFYEDAHIRSTTVNKEKSKIKPKHILLWLFLYLIVLIMKFLFKK